MDRQVTKKRLFVIVIMLPLALLLTGYLAWPVWIVPLVRGVLKNVDVKLEQVDIHRPGWHGLIISDLKLRYSTGEYNSIVTLPEVSLSYTWQGLLQGQLETLQIPVTHVQLDLLGDDAKVDENKSIGDEPLSITEFLPQALFSQLPFSQLYIDSLQLRLPEAVGYQDLSGSLYYNGQQLQLNLSCLKKPETNLSSFQLNLEIDQQNSVQLELQRNAQPILMIDSSVAGDLGPLEGKLRFDLQTATELLQEFGLLGEDYQLEGDAQLHWQLPLPDEIAGKDWAVTARFQAKLGVNKFKLAQLSAESLALSGTGQVYFSPDNIHLQFDADSKLQANKAQAQDLLIEALKIKMPRVFDVVLQQQQQLTVPDFEFQVGVTQFSWQAEDYRFAAAQVQLKDVLMTLQNPVQLSSYVDVSLLGIEALGGDLNLKPLDVQGSWKLKKEILGGTVQFSYANGLILADGDMAHNFSSGQGYLNSKLQRLNFQQDQSYLPRLFENWTYPFDLFTGRLDMSTQLNWDTGQVYTKGRLTLTDVGGFYDTNLFRGLNSELLIDATLDDIKLTAKQFTVASVDAGVSVENISFSLQSTVDRLQIKDFKAELLGGQVGQRLVNYDWTQDQNDLLLQIKGIQLGELLNLEAGVEGLGVLDGQLPISISSTGIAVSQSEIKARSPGGFIKYQGAKSMSSAVADVGVGFAIEALENFHYDMLDVKASYSEDGQLKLQTVLLGRNPDMSEQRPVRYNINIQENIPALIQSLKLTQQLSDDIERRIQAFYKKDNRE